MISSAKFFRGFSLIVVTAAAAILAQVLAGGPGSVTRASFF